MENFQGMYLIIVNDRIVHAVGLFLSLDTWRGFITSQALSCWSSR